MDKKEFSMFVMALKTYYPRENLLPNNQAIELWFRQLEDIPYQVAEASLNKWVATNKWSPSIADIRETASTIQEGELPDWGDAWEKVLLAIRQFGMYQVGEAMETFDAITKQCVERLGFRNLCLSENINQDRANFRMIYEQLSERKKKDAQIPMQLHQLIGEIQNRKLMIESNGGSDEK